MCVRARVRELNTRHFNFIRSLCLPLSPHTPADCFHRARHLAPTDASCKPKCEEGPRTRREQWAAATAQHSTGQSRSQGCAFDKRTAVLAAASAARTAGAGARGGDLMVSMGWVTASATSPLTAPAVKVTNLLSSCTLRFLRMLMGVFTPRERPACHVPAGGRSSGTGSTYLTKRTRAKSAQGGGGVRSRRMFHRQQQRCPEARGTARARSTPPLVALRPRRRKATCEEHALRHAGVSAPAGRPNARTPGGRCTRAHQ